MSPAPPRTRPPGAPSPGAPSPGVRRLQPSAQPTVLEQSRRRSERVRRLRRASPWVMVAVALLVAGWVGGRAIVSALHPDDTGRQVRMSRPHFIGRDDHGKPYDIAATQAVRDPVRDEIVHLTDPDMRLHTDAPGPARLRGRTGVFNEATGVLSVAGAVVFEDGSGDVFHSERTRIDTQTLEVRGDAPVRGEGPIGRISALSYAVHNRGEDVVFTGDVHSHINNDRSADRKPEPPRP